MDRGHSNHRLRLLIHSIVPYEQVYWAGPIVGGIVAALLYQKVFRARSPEEEQEIEDYKYRAADVKENEIIADRTTTI